MNAKRFAAALLSISILYSFCSFASQFQLNDTDYERSEIAALEDEVIYRVNEGGASADLSRDVRREDINFDRAYRVYDDPGIFAVKTDDSEEIKQVLQSGRYLWQVPIFIGSETVLVDIFKNTEISDDIPEDIQEELRKTLGQWQVGAIYVYENRTVDFQNAVTESLSKVGLSADDHIYEFVSGIPGIRYPVAVVFDQNKAKYIVPAELESAQAFEEGCERMEYTGSASPSNAFEGRKMSGNIFPVYNFKDVSKVSQSSNKIGLGGGIGISPLNTVKHTIFRSILIIGSVLVGFTIVKKIGRRFR